jgi:hypothetical protein
VPKSLLPGTRRCARRGCPNALEPDARSDARYCSDRCRKRAHRARAAEAEAEEARLMRVAEPQPLTTEGSDASWDHWDSTIWRPIWERTW